MNIQKGKNLKYILGSLFISIILNIILIYLVKPNMNHLNTVCLWGLGIIYLAALCYLVLHKYSAYSIKENKKLFVSILFASVLAALIFMFILPFRFGQILKSNLLEELLTANNQIEIEVLDEKNESSVGNSIWLEGIILDGKDYNLYEIPLTNGWERIDGRIAAINSNPENLIIDLPIHGNYSILFRRQNDAGIIKLKIGTSEYSYDLYDINFNQRAELDLNNLIELDYNTKMMRERFIFYIVEGVILWIISLNIITYLTTAHIKKKHIITAYEK